MVTYTPQFNHRVRHRLGAQPRRQVDPMIDTVARNIVYHDPASRDLMFKAVSAVAIGCAFFAIISQMQVAR